MKKSILILTVAAALVIGLALTGCPSATEDVTVRDATNTRLSAPREVTLSVGYAGWDYRGITGESNGRATLANQLDQKNTTDTYIDTATPHIAFYFRGSESEDKYDVTYKFYVRQKGTNTFYEIVGTAGNPSSTILIPEFFPGATKGNSSIVQVNYPNVLYPKQQDGTLDEHPLTKNSVKLYNSVTIPTDGVIKGGSPVTNTYAQRLLNSYSAPTGDIRTYGQNNITTFGQFKSDVSSDLTVPNIDQAGNQNTYPAEGIYVFFKKPDLVRVIDGQNRAVRAIRLIVKVDNAAAPAIKSDLPRKDFTYTIVVAQADLAGTGDKPFDAEPFSPNEEYEFGVQAILSSSQYQQQTIKIDPSEIKWDTENSWKRQ